MLFVSYSHKDAEIAEHHGEINRALIATLGVPEEPVRLPCLTLFRVQGDVCSHVRQVPLEPRSPLLLVTDMIEGIHSYRAFIASDRGVSQGPVEGAWPAVRASLTIVDLVNTVSDFAERATQAVQSVLF